MTHLAVRISPDYGISYLVKPLLTYRDARETVARLQVLLLRFYVGSADLKKTPIWLDLLEFRDPRIRAISVCGRANPLEPGDITQLSRTVFAHVTGEEDAWLAGQPVWTPDL